MELPVFFSVTPRALVPPTATFPKRTLLGVALSCATGATPAPAKLIVVGELSASLVTVRLPERAPEEDGVNRICKVTLWLAAIEDKGVPWVTVNAAPETLVWETVTVVFPPFVNVTLFVVLLPTAMFPKLMLVGVAERVFELVDCVFALE